MIHTYTTTLEYTYIMYIITEFHETKTELKAMKTKQNILSQILKNKLFIYNLYFMTLLFIVKNVDVLTYKET